VIALLAFISFVVLLWGCASSRYDLRKADETLGLAAALR
jgi:nitrogen fixation-related uncharacterized protein